FITLQRLQGESGSAIPDFLSTHPNPADRYETVNQLAFDWKKQLNLTEARVNRNSYLKLIDGLVYGEDPRQGYVENNVFYHPGLKFKMPVPANWQYLNSPQQFQMAPKDGKAIMNLTLAPGGTLEAAAQQMLQQYKLQPIESKSTTVNGLPALAVVADQQQEQQTIRTLTYFIEYDGNIYSIMGISTADAFASYTNQFAGTMQNFSSLTDQTKLNRQPARIRVETVQQAGSVRQVFQRYQVPEDRMQELAVLNGRQLEDRLEQGTMIKLLTKYDKI
ncbi:MAG: peptidase M48, partial [Hymenobacteraceae bacterium]|nr:peptidase M48 [Hymenobacteraceae bacterium]MDX5395422.1 peptidase M48 [Hymenobacteraceae bacterium]MDX5511471.1 peptidase M48 [Hymenobacteraceae bacterium]